ncbi:DUF1015 family protein [Actinopolyspora mortivallis]|uniref:DUF1015 family protein n=1 Tax=Actinopolyspora mortivallis TaxID=33906 RepID=UPI00037AFF1A|nr:DUF1015 family protein [Actinopolyspora mortivallis]
MSAPQRQSPRAVAEAGAGGITVRPPRVSVIAPHAVESLDGCLDPNRVRDLLETGGYVRPMLPAVLVYRLRSGRHEQTGVVVEVSLEDYRNGRIRRHEATRPDRERRIAELTEASGAEQMPVMLTHPDLPALASSLRETTRHTPDVGILSSGGVEHSVWIRRDAELAGLVRRELGALSRVYIADGHHRMAVAERRSRTRPHRDTDTRSFTLAALFPGSEMRVLGYHRCLPEPPGLSTSEILDVLAEHPTVARVEECPRHAPSNPAPGMVLLRLHDRCFRLWLDPSGSPDRSVRGTLDAVVLDEQLYPYVARLVDSAGSTVPADPSGTRCWCASRNAVCFVPRPPDVEQIMAVSDTGAVMPPKSTCFDPKTAPGLFVRELH